MFAKKWKILFISCKELFRFSRFFVFPSSLQFHLVDDCFRGWSEINLKVYDVINCLYNTSKVQPCKLYNNKYMIAWIQITNTEIFGFMAVVVYKLLSCKVLFTNTEIFGLIAVLVLMLLSCKVFFINKKDNRNLKSRLLCKNISTCKLQ